MNGNLSGFALIAIAAAASCAVGATNGAAVNMRNFQGIGKFAQNSAATSGGGITSDTKLQHSDDGVNDWTDVAGGAFPQVTNAAARFDELMVNADNLKSYVRAVTTVTGAGTVIRSVEFIGTKQRS